MGIEKDKWMRGWRTPETFVCADCIEDDYLKTVVEESAASNTCDYCGTKSQEEFSAPLEAIVEPIAGALFAHYAEPGAACLPRDDGEWVGEERITDTGDALESIGLTCDEQLFDDIVASFSNTAWYPCARGFWLHQHRHVELHYSWESFVDEVKHRSRYFFSRGQKKNDLLSEEDYPPLKLLEAIGEMVVELGLISSIPSGTQLYRVRQVKPGRSYKTFEDLGPPPESLAEAGRMNPAGISYFYLAFDPKTALAEVLREPPFDAALARFQTKTELRVLDLAQLPPVPSVFDAEKRYTRETLLFLEGFVEAIAQPITRDGREHVDYVPSQVVSEFFAQVFQTEDGKGLDGVAYPSAVMRGGRNLVLFPIRDFKRDLTGLVALQAVENIEFKDKADLKREVGIEKQFDLQGNLTLLGID